MKEAHSSSDQDKAPTFHNCCDKKTSLEAGLSQSRLIAHTVSTDFDTVFAKKYVDSFRKTQEAENDIL